MSFLPTKVTLSSEAWALYLRVSQRSVFEFVPVAMRPPVLEDMLPDIDRLIHSVSSRFCDRTSVHLHYDEMAGECRAKLAEIIDRGEVERQPTRTHFFKFFKTALQNQARSRVQKYRFTEKRTGIKPPPREQRVFTNRGQGEDDDCHHDSVVVVPEHHKNVELSLDDEELNLQVSSPLGGLGVEDDQAYLQVAQEFGALLTEVELLVYKQLVLPSQKASNYAWLEACRGRKRGSLGCIQIKITHAHLAEAIGLDPALFEEAVLSIRQKIIAYRNMTDAERLQESRRSATLAQLKQVFGLQIPPGSDDMLVRRMLTIAARDQFEEHVKDNPQVQEMLEAVGAKVPRLMSDKQLACYGVLYQRNQRQCNHCGLRESCALEAANVGLGKIALSPRLLGGRQTRVPVVLPVESDVPVPGSTDAADIINYLDETFVRSKRRDEVYYSLNNQDMLKRRFLFCVEESAETPFSLRFCNPSQDLRARLQGQKRSWYALPTASVQDIIALVDQHAKESLTAHAEPAQHPGS